MVHHIEASGTYEAECDDILAHSKRRDEVDYYLSWALHVLCAGPDSTLPKAEWDDDSVDSEN